MTVGTAPSAIYRTGRQFRWISGITWFSMIGLMLYTGIASAQGGIGDYLSGISGTGVLGAFWVLMLFSMWLLAELASTRAPATANSAPLFRAVICAVLVWDASFGIVVGSKLQTPVVLNTTLWILSFIIVPRWWMVMQQTSNRPLPLWAACLPFAYILMLVLLFGVTDGRNLAGVHPNFHGATAAFGLLLCAFARGRVGLIEAGLAVAICMFVQSRGGAVLCIGFVMFWYLLSAFDRYDAKGMPPRRLFMLVMVFLASLIAVAGVLTDTLWQTVDALFLISDRSRGIGSGLTGRVDLWGPAIEYGVRHPFTGRAEWYTGIINLGHNAYIGLIYQYGLIPAVVILLFLGVRIFWIVSASIRHPEDRVLRAIAAFLLAVTVYSVFELWMLTFAMPRTVIIWIMIMYPVSRVARSRAPLR